MKVRLALPLLVALILFVPVANAENTDSLLIPLSLSSKEQILPKAAISRAELLEDIKELEFVFRKGYGGWPTLQVIFKAHAFPALENLEKSSYSTEEFCEHVGRVLDAVPDNHLSAIFYGSDKCGKTPERIGQVGKNIRAREDVPWGVYRKEIAGIEVPVMSITHLPNYRFAGWNGFTEKIRELAANSTALVIDLRGNGGGDDTMPTRMAKILFGMEDADYAPQPPARVVRSQTPEALAVFVNNYGFRILLSRIRGQEPTPDLFETYDEWHSRYLDAKAGRLPPNIEFRMPKVEPDLSKIFKGPIRVLIDADCGSSCESTLEALEFHPNVKTVGENTAGYVHFGNMGRIWLRRSNVIVAVPTQRLEFDDGRFVEKSGYSPTTEVSPGTDAMGVALDDIASELGLKQVK